MGSKLAILMLTGMSWDVRQFSVVPHISINGARVVFRFGCHAPLPNGLSGDGKRPRRAPACSKERVKYTEGSGILGFLFAGILRIYPT